MSSVSGVSGVAGASVSWLMVGPVGLSAGGVLVAGAGAAWVSC